MARITVVINQKGGVGKTTTAHALATGLLKRGFNVLVIDTDPQGNISNSMQADVNVKGLYEAMKEESPAKEVIQHTPQGDIMPSTLLLTAADMEFTQTGREFILDNVLENVKNNYDYIIIDSPPQLGILTINALVASDDIIIPMTADIYSLQGLNQLYSTITKVRKFCKKNIVIAGLLLTRHDDRIILSRDLREAIENKAKEFNSILYDTVIRNGVSIREAQTARQSIFDYAPKSNQAVDYMNFITEYVKRERY